MDSWMQELQLVRHVSVCLGNQAWRISAKGQPIRDKRICVRTSVSISHSSNMKHLFSRLLQVPMCPETGDIAEVRLEKL